RGAQNEAVDILARAVESNSDSRELLLRLAEARLRLGRIQSERKRWAEAEKTFAAGIANAERPGQLKSPRARSLLVALRYGRAVALGRLAQPGNGKTAIGLLRQAYEADLALAPARRTLVAPAKNDDLKPLHDLPQWKAFLKWYDAKARPTP